MEKIVSFKYSSNAIYVINELHKKGITAEINEQVNSKKKLFEIMVSNDNALKAKAYIDKGIYNISIDEKLKGSDLFKDELYEYLIWTRGHINHTLKNYRLASKDFKALALRFPDNDRYRNWYNGSSNYVPNQIMWGFTAFIFLLLFSKYVMGFKSELYFYLDLIGLLGLVGTWIYKTTTRLK